MGDVIPFHRPDDLSQEQKDAVRKQAAFWSEIEKESTELAIYAREMRQRALEKLGMCVMRKVQEPENE